MIKATVDAMGVTNNTDQQQFATVTPEGVVSSKLPNGVTNNMACVGKEPTQRGGHEGSEPGLCRPPAEEA